MSTLTDRQRLELHKSLIQYLTPLISDSNDIPSTDKELLTSTLYKTLSIDEQDFQQNASKTIPESYLVKKWSAVLRLQKKIMELENNLQQYKEFPMTTISTNSDEWLPTKLLKNLKNFGNCSITSISIHPFEPILATGTSDGMIIIWDLLDLVEPLKMIKNAHTKSVNSLKFSPSTCSINDVKQVLLASSSSDLVIKIWGQDFQSIRSLTGHDHLISCILFHPQNTQQLVSCSRDCAIKLWDLSSGWCLKTFVGHSDWVRKLDLNVTGEYVLSCSNDQSVRISHLETGTGIGLMIGHGQVVENCKFFNNERSNKFLDKLCLKYLFNNSEDDFKILDHDTYDKLNFKYCVSCGRDDLIKIWLLPLPQLRPHRPPLPSSTNPNGSLILTLSNHSSWVRDIQIHPNGRFLFSCSDDKTIKIWDLADDCKCVKTLNKHEAFVNCIEFASPIIDEDSNEDHKIGYRNYFVSGGVDKVVVWG